MATWTNQEKLTWEFADDKLNFDAWLTAHPETKQAWLEICTKHAEHAKENPDVEHFDNPHGEAAADIINTWIAYADAKQV